MSERQMAEMRATLTRADLERLLPDSPMTGYEFAAAVERDRLQDDLADDFDMAAYDRRGLLNVIAALAAVPPHTPGALDRSEWHVSDEWCGYCAATHDEREADFMNGKKVRRLLVEAASPSEETTDE